MRFFEEIARREERNDDKIVLYPEGLFYKAYDRSAFACVSRISSFKPSKKRIKYCAREMASIGFPAVALPKYFPAAPQPLSDGRVEITLGERIDAEACETWKASLPLKERRPRGSSKAYLPTLGRNGKTGDLFVHPADLLPDIPALAAGTTGPKQPAQAMGGKGAVQDTYPSDTAEPATGTPESAAPRPAAAYSGPGHGFLVTGASAAATGITGTAALRPDGGRLSGAERMPATGEFGPQGEPLRPSYVPYGTAASASATGTAGTGRETPERLTWLGRLLRKLTHSDREAGKYREDAYILGRETLTVSGRYAAPKAIRPGIDGTAGVYGGPGVNGGTGVYGGTTGLQGRPLSENFSGSAGSVNPAANPGKADSALNPAAEIRPAQWRTDGSAMLPTANNRTPMSPARCEAIPTTEGRGQTLAADDRGAMPPARCETIPANGNRGTAPTSTADRRGTRDAARRETKEERVARLIREFRLEAATPVECLLFVADLKKEIDGYL